MTEGQSRGEENRQSTVVGVEADQEDEDSQAAVATPARQINSLTGASAASTVPPSPPSSSQPEPSGPAVVTAKENPEEVEGGGKSFKEKKDERRENLQALIDDFAEISEDELQNYNEFRQLSNGEKVKNALKSFARRAVVYAAFGVGIGLLTQAAPAAIAVSIAGGFGGSTLGRGLVDAVKIFSGAEKKEQEIQSQISKIQTDKIKNLITLARRVKSLENLPGQQGQNPETSEITTIEQAKRDFLEALIDFNDMESQNNRQIAGLRKKLSRSQRGWGIAKTVVGAIGGVTGGIAASAGLKAVLYNKVTEEGIQMTCKGLGVAAPDIPPGHLVHMHGDMLVFNYNDGELDTIYDNIANSPELAQSFITDQATAELVKNNMHQAGEEIYAEFVKKAIEIAAERTAAYIVGAVATAEATNAVLQATARNRGNRFVSESSDNLRKEAAEYRRDLQAEASARQNERFRLIFADEYGRISEAIPSIGETITIEKGFVLRGQEVEIVVNSGDHLQIMGLDQNGNVLVKHVETEQWIAFQRGDFYRNIIQPRIFDDKEAGNAPEGSEEEGRTDREESSAEGENSPEKEREELIGNVKTVKIDKKINDRQFICKINGKPRRVTVFGRPSESIEAGLQAKIKILEVWGGDNEFVNADVERVFRSNEFEEVDNTYKFTEPELRNLAQEALSRGAEWVLASGNQSRMIAERLAEPSDKIERIQIKAGEKYILDNITKHYHRVVVVFHRIDQRLPRDIMLANPGTFLERLTPVFIKEIQNEEEQRKARRILREEYQRLVENIPSFGSQSDLKNDETIKKPSEKDNEQPGPTKSVGEIVNETTEPGEQPNIGERAKENEEVKKDREFEKITSVEQLKTGDRICISDQAPENIKISTSDAEESKNLVRDFRPKTEFTFNGPAPEKEGVGLFEIERKGVKYYLYDEDIVNGFELIKKPPESERESGSKTSLQRDGEQVVQATSGGESQLEPEEEQSLQSYDFEYGLNDSGEQVRKEIAPGQIWRIISSDDRSYDFEIERIDAAEPGTLTIKFRDTEPKTRTVEGWKRFFKIAEYIRSEGD